MSLSIIVLGTSAIFPRPRKPCSGYLFRSPRTRMLVDCGPGTFAALQEHVRPQELTAVWISHLHPDHCADLLSLVNWAINTPDTKPVRVFGPPGWARRIAAMLPMDDATSALHEAFAVEHLGDGNVATVDDLRITSRSVQHGVPAFGIRVEYADQVVAYSGDSGPCSALVDLAREANLFICEAGARTAQRNHCTPSDAGTISAAARSRRLALTHLADGVAESDAAADATRAANCMVEVAQPGDNIVIS
jgi:ribonuclease BN (tRNA processing enzyme)